jgi:hypothetical protein
VQEEINNLLDKFGDEVLGKRLYRTPGDAKTCRSLT